METNEAGGAHYGKGLQPWDLQKDMQTWGSVFIDARRTDAMEYLFRTKGDRSKQLDDARKAKHNCEVIIAELEKVVVPEPIKAPCPVKHTLDNLQLEVNGKCSVCGNPWPIDQYHNKPETHVGDDLVMFHPSHNVIEEDGNSGCTKCGVDNVNELKEPCLNAIPVNHPAYKAIKVNKSHKYSSDSDKCMNCGKTGMSLTMPCTNPDIE